MHFFFSYQALQKTVLLLMDYYSWKFGGEEKNEILYGSLNLELVQHESIL